MILGKLINLRLIFLIYKNEDNFPLQNVLRELKKKTHLKCKADIYNIDNIGRPREGELNSWETQGRRLFILYPFVTWTLNYMNSNLFKMFISFNLSMKHIP